MIDNLESRQQEDGNRSSILLCTHSLLPKLFMWPAVRSSDMEWQSLLLFKSLPRCAAVIHF